MEPRSLLEIPSARFPYRREKIVLLQINEPNNCLISRLQLPVDKIDFVGKKISARNIPGANIVKSEEVVFRTASDFFYAVFFINTVQRFHHIFHALRYSPRAYDFSGFFAEAGAHFFVENQFQKRIAQFLRRRKNKSVLIFTHQIGSAADLIRYDNGQIKIHSFVDD